MRKVTEQSIDAFLIGRPGTFGNTTVEVTGWGAKLLLHGNLIAEKNYNTGKIIATLAGWNTPTTRERLNGLALKVGGTGVYQRNFKAYLDGGTEIDPSDWYTVKEAA